MHSTHVRTRSDAELRLLFSFFASMLWQDGALHSDEHHALALMAEQLGLLTDDPWVAIVFELPPAPEDVDPQRIPRTLATAVLGVASLAASVRPSLAKYEALELLEALLGAEPVPVVLELLAA